MVAWRDPELMRRSRETGRPAFPWTLTFKKLLTETNFLMREGLVPDVSLGTHFFNDLVEMQVLYLALVPGREGNHVNASLIECAPNNLARLIPEEAAWARAVRVIDPAGIPGGRVLRLHADALRQSAVCYFEPS